MSDATVDSPLPNQAAVGVDYNPPGDEPAEPQPEPEPVPVEAEDVAE